MSPIDISPKHALEKGGKILADSSAAKEFKRESTTARLVGAGMDDLLSLCKTNLLTSVIRLRRYCRAHSLPPS